jgi:dihydroxyacetone kinase-like predicted kinase
MREAISAVRSGEVTRAIKNAKASNGTPIHDGDIIGIADDRIEVVGGDITEVALKLVALIINEADTLTILAGEELEDSHFRNIVARIEEAHPDLEVDAHRGEQPLYPLVMAAE